MSIKTGANCQDAPRLFTYSHVAFTQKWFGPPNRYDGNSLFTAPFSPSQMHYVVVIYGLIFVRNGTFWAQKTFFLQANTLYFVEKLLSCKDNLIWTNKNLFRAQYIYYHVSCYPHKCTMTTYFTLDVLSLCAGKHKLGVSLARSVFALCALWFVSALHSTLNQTRSEFSSCVWSEHTITVCHKAGQSENWRR